MAEAAPNPLLTTARASDTSPHIQLHPLVLLTISDYITRHTLRKLPGPIVGAILGQQNGREITMEVAFNCPVTAGEDGEVILNETWFQTRLEQYKTVYKTFDLVGWFTLGPTSGPQPHVLPIHERLQAAFNESALLLLFHPETEAHADLSTGKLPLTIYESLWESSAGNDKDMDIDGQVAAKEIKFRELPYTVETGEAEMISVDFVARGGGNATAVPTAPAKSTSTGSPSTSDVKDKAKAPLTKGKGRVTDADEEEEPIDETAALTPEEEELLSSLTAKYNAVKMLHRRIKLLQTYLSSLPPSYLSDANLDPSAVPDEINFPILRAISALLARLPILAPPDAEAFTRETEEERSDVELISMLSSITSSIDAVKEMGQKFSVVETARYKQRQRKGAFGGFDGYGPFTGDFNPNSPDQLPRPPVGHRVRGKWHRG